MTKADFTKKLAEKANVSNKEAAAVLAAFEEVVMEDIFAKEDSVRLAIGTFSGYTKVTSDRQGRNPATGETILIKGKKCKGFPKFKPSKTAKMCD